jgi:sulfur transfer complex TusBCD TusB component (DsrH family)
MQNVLTVEMNVRYHSSQKMTDLFIVENVSKIINQNNVVAAMVEDLVAAMVEDLVAAMVEDLVAAMVEDLVAAMVEEIEIPDLVEETTDQEKCLMQNVLTVEMNVRYHSSQKMTDLFIVENVSKITEIISKLF